MAGATLHISRRQALGVAAGSLTAAAGGAAALRAFTSAPHPAASAEQVPDWPSPLGDRRVLAAHLLRRAGFGYTGDDLDRAAALAYDDLVEQVLTQQAEPLPPPVTPTSYLAVVRSWLTHMATTPAQFPERMAFFWHGLLTSDFRGGTHRPFVLQQNQLYRDKGRSDLRTLLTAVTYDPLMMRYLNLAQSTAQKPNENYARELMELFSLGPGNYTEHDVRESARALSGLRIRPTASGFAGVLVPHLHDNGTKTFLGHTGNLGPEDVIDAILAQPACAPFIAHRALVAFCSPAPQTSLVNDVASQFRTSGYDITTLMRTIFTSDTFKAASYRALVRSPVDYMVATMRALSRADLAGHCIAAGRGMNQVPYDMPNVAGWPSNAGWIASGAWLARVNFAADVVASQGAFPTPASGLRDQLDGVVGPDTAAVLKPSASTADYWHALLASPEFHLK